MRCHSSSVPTTPPSASHVARPARQNRRHAARHPSRPTARSSTRARRSRPAASTPSIISAVLSSVGDGDEPGVDVDACAQPGCCAAPCSSVNDAGDLRLLLDRQRAGGAGDPDEVGADAADVGPEVQRAARAGVDRGAWRHRGDGVTECDDDDVGVGADEQAVAAGVDAGRAESSRTPAARRRAGVATALARDDDVEGQRRARHQRGGDVGRRSRRTRCPAATRSSRWSA